MDEEGHAYKSLSQILDTYNQHKIPWNNAQYISFSNQNMYSVLGFQIR